MDSDDEEAFAALMEEEAEADTDDQEHLMNLAAQAGPPVRPRCLAEYIAG